MRKKALIVIALILAFANSGAMMIQQNANAKPTPTPQQTEKNIKFCHATNSVTNPYNMIETDANSIIKEGHGGHIGLPGLVVSYMDEAQMYKNMHISWGDIIPPFDYKITVKKHEINVPFVGLNYTSEGKQMIQNNCQYEYTVAPEVVFTDSTCSARSGSYTIPDKKGVSYYAKGVFQSSGTHQVIADGSITITAKANKYYTLDPKATSSWTHNFVIKTDTDCAMTIPEIAPVTLSCEGDGSYTVPATEGIQYYGNGVLLTAGVANPVNKDSKITITAVAMPGYSIANEELASQELSIIVPTTESCMHGITNITPAAVTFVDPTCSALGSYTIPTTEGINYQINGVTVNAGVYSPKNGETITVTAVPSAEKNSIKAGATTSWSKTFTAPDNCGSVLGETTVKSLPNTSGTGMNPIAYLAAFSIALLTTLGAAMKRFYMERL